MCSAPRLQYASQCICSGAAWGRRVERRTSQKRVVRPEGPLRALEVRRLSHEVQRSPSGCSVLQKPHTCRVAHLHASIPPTVGIMQAAAEDSRLQRHIMQNISGDLACVTVLWPIHLIC